MKRRCQWILSLREKKDPDNDENAIEFRWSDLQGEVEEDIALANLIESLCSILMRKIYQKVTGGLFDDYCIVSYEKKN